MIWKFRQNFSQSVTDRHILSYFPGVTWKACQNASVDSVMYSLWLNSARGKEWYVWHTLADFSGIAPLSPQQSRKSQSLINMISAEWRNLLTRMTRASFNRLPGNGIISEETVQTDQVFWFVNKIFRRGCVVAGALKRALKFKFVGGV